VFSISDPRPGEHGGEIVFYGPVRELKQAKGSLTADYLFGRKRVEITRVMPMRLARRSRPKPRCTHRSAAEHNSKNIDVEIPLQRLVCITASAARQIHAGHDVLFPRCVGPKASPPKTRAYTGRCEVPN